MDLKKKILVIIGFCIILSSGSFIIINSMFSKIEDQLFQKCRMEALIGARVMSDMMEFMLMRKLLTEAEIMDTDYVRIPGSNPPKYSTRYDKVFDANIQRIEDEFLFDSDVNYAILIDRNGYVPTHNSKYSKPQGPDVKQNIMFSRSKRNFGTDSGIREALQYRGYGTVKMLYSRDTSETIWNIGAPVRVRGQHWGAFLIGVSLQRIEAIKNQMVILIVTLMFVILSLTMLAILAVIPRKYLPEDLNTPKY